MERKQEAKKCGKEVEEFGDKIKDLKGGSLITLTRLLT